MAIYIYRSTDTSAPVLSGTAGTLINVLDACLVNGYGSKSSMGWTKEYSGTNLATYRMPVGTSRMYMAVDDTGTTLVRYRGFHDCTAAGIGITVGTNPFPNDFQLSGGSYFSKSGTANTTARPQIVVSNGKIFYMIVDPNSDGFSTSRQHCFGDIYSYNPYETNSCILIGQDINSSNPFAAVGPPNTNFSANHFLALRYDGIQKGSTCSKGVLSGLHGSWISTRIMGGSALQLLVYPHPIGGGIFLSPIIIAEAYGSSMNVIRGRLPGIQAPIHNMPFATGDSFEGGVGTSLEGKSFEAIKQYWYSGSSYYGNTVVEISDTQDTPFIK